MKTKLFLVASCLFLLGSLTNGAVAQTMTYDQGYEYGYGLGKEYATNKARGYEYRTQPQDANYAGWTVTYRRWAPDQYTYDSMRGHIAQWRYNDPDNHIYYKGIEHGMYDGYVNNFFPWLAFSMRPPEDGGPSIIPELP